MGPRRLHRFGRTVDNLPVRLERAGLVRLYVDGNAHVPTVAPDDTVDDLLESIRNQPIEPGAPRAFLGLVCDGIDVLGGELSEVLTRPVSDYERIDVQTGDPAETVAGALRDALATLDTVETHRADVVALLGEGKTPEAMKRLADCLGLWVQINEVITQSVSLLSVTKKDVRSDVDQFTQLLQPVMSRLSEIKEAVASQDFVTLADVLSYEFDEVREAWRSAIQLVLDHAAV